MNGRLDRWLIEMNVELLQFINKLVRVKGDITHQEYKVLGILWDNDNLILSGEKGNFKVHHSKATLVPEEKDEDEGWYTP